MGSKTLKIFLFFFTILNVADAITALFILEGESNPLYIWTGTIVIPIILKCLLVGLAWLVYLNNSYPSKTSYFTFIYVIIIGTLLLTFGVVSNAIGILSPNVVTQSSQLSETVKISYYANIMLMMYIIPYVISLFAFKTYIKSEDKVIFDKKAKFTLFKKWR